MLNTVPRPPGASARRQPGPPVPQLRTHAGRTSQQAGSGKPKADGSLLCGHSEPPAPGRRPPADAQRSPPALSSTLLTKGLCLRELYIPLVGNHWHLRSGSTQRVDTGKASLDATDIEASRATQAHRPQALVHTPSPRWATPRPGSWGSLLHLLHPPLGRSPSASPTSLPTPSSLSSQACGPSSAATPGPQHLQHEAPGPCGMGLPQGPRSDKRADFAGARCPARSQGPGLAVTSRPLPRPGSQEHVGGYLLGARTFWAGLPVWDSSRDFGFAV